MNEKLLIENGSLISPDLHDAEVLGLLLVGKDCLLLPLKLSDGSPTGIIFRDVVRLRAMDFRQGNIALDMEVMVGDEVDAEDLVSLYDGEKMAPSLSIDCSIKFVPKAGSS